MWIASLIESNHDSDFDRLRISFFSKFKSENLNIYLWLRIFLFVQKMRKIIVSEILNQMSEGLFNYKLSPTQIAWRQIVESYICVGANFEFQSVLERKRRLKRNRVFSMNTFAELQKSGMFHTKSLLLNISKKFYLFRCLKFRLPPQIMIN